MMEKNKTTLLIGSSGDANIFYATRHLCSDPLVWISFGDQEYIISRNLEVDGLKRKTVVNDIFAFDNYANKETAILKVLEELKAPKKILVPENFPLYYGEFLKQNGYDVTAKRDPFFEARIRKTEEEINNIIEVQTQLEEVFGLAIKIIKDSEVRGDYLYYYFEKGGEFLTSKILRDFIELELYKRGCLAKNTIVACSNESIEPHNRGSDSTLFIPNTPIIIDVFPQSRKTGYFTDMTRVVVKGAATEKYKQQYAVDLAGQELALSLIKSGVDGSTINQAVFDFFLREGYKESEIKHRVGHGIGLELHEFPYISSEKNTLEKGNVFTVEPGLYTEENGGARIEDVVVVTDGGYTNLTKLPKKLLEL